MARRKFIFKILYKFFKVIVIIFSVFLGFISFWQYSLYLNIDKKLRIERQEHIKIFPSVKPPKELFDFRKTHPEYNDIDDYTLVGKLASKYPQYTELKKKVEDYHNLIRKKEGEEKSGLKTYTIWQEQRREPGDLPLLREEPLKKGISFKWTKEKPPSQDDIEELYQQLNRYEINIHYPKRWREGAIDNAIKWLIFALCIPIIFFGGIALYKYLFPIKKEN